MNLLLIASKIWRYKLVTLPILVTVLLAAVYTAAIKAPVYQTSSSYILVPPPAPPTPDEIARDPKLGRGSDNPYTRFSDQSLVVQVLSTRLSSDDTRRALAAQGADVRYTAAPDVALGMTAPIVQITGLGSSPAAAIKTADVVGAALTHELARMQEVHGVAPRYRIETQQVVAAREASLKASGQLRALVAVLVMGAIVLFFVVSILDALAALRQSRRPKAGDGDDAPAERTGPNGAPHEDRSPTEAWQIPRDPDTGRYTRPVSPLRDRDPAPEPWPQ